jgi:hypothetical protein
MNSILFSYILLDSFINNPQPDGEPKIISYEFDKIYPVVLGIFQKTAFVNSSDDTL